MEGSKWLLSIGTKSWNIILLLLETDLETYGDSISCQIIGLTFQGNDLGR